LFLTTALFNQIVSLEPEAFKELRYLLFGGEAVDPQWVKVVLEQGAPEHLLHVYGPTENTTFSTWFKVKEVLPDTVTIPIGQPISNTTAYILDGNQQIMPVGVAGELYMGGDGLARGYLNQPELTQEKFIPNPFVSEPSARLYRTGDIARYLADGNIEFIGRSDNQVKIRGFRIELGEIESVLNNHPDVKQGVVVTKQDSQHNQRIVAYVTSNCQNLSNVQLRSYLEQHLPFYMLPNVFLVLDSLPLTPNGKIDRKALPNIDENSLSISGETLVLPRDSIELGLAQIWSDLINVKLVDITANFFEMGGHSLLAVSLMSQIQQQFQINLPLSTLFEHPTIEEIAHLIRSSKDDLPWSVLVPIKPHGNRTPLFCIHPGGGTVFCYQHLAYHLNSDQPVYGLQAYGLNPKNSPHTNVEQMASFYIQEIKKIQPHGPYFLCGWSLGGLIAFEIAQQLFQQGSQIAFLAILDSYPPDLAIDEEIPTPEDDASSLLQLLLEDEDLDISPEQLADLTEEEQLTYVLKKAQEKKLYPENFDLAQARLLLKILQISYRAALDYKPQYLQVSLDLFIASDTPDKFKSLWDTMVNRVESYSASGEHGKMVEPPHVQLLAEQMQKSLDRAQQITEK
jgi:thioesterase domain-containing protein/acyl carrier protein